MIILLVLQVFVLPRSVGHQQGSEWYIRLPLSARSEHLADIFLEMRYKKEIYVFSWRLSLSDGCRNLVILSGEFLTGHSES